MYIYLLFLFFFSFFIFICFFTFLVFFFFFTFLVFFFFFILIFFFVVIICYLDFSQNFYCHGIRIFYLDLSTWICLFGFCLLGFVLEVSVYCIMRKSYRVYVYRGQCPESSKKGTFYEVLRRNTLK